MKKHLAFLPRIPCPKCRTVGTVPLPKPLREVLTVLRNSRSTPREIHEALGNQGIGVTAICNRLEQLRGLGLVDRAPAERGWVYFKTKKL